MRHALLVAALAALSAHSPAQAQVFPPEPVGAGWKSVDLTADGIEGTLRITWTVKAGMGNLTVVCGAWAADTPELAPHAAAALARSTASEGDRLLLSSLSHFAAAGDLTQLDGSAAPCRQTTAVSTGGVTVSIHEGEVLIPVASGS